MSQYEASKSASTRSILSEPLAEAESILVKLGGLSADEILDQPFKKWQLTMQLVFIIIADQKHGLLAKTPEFPMQLVKEMNQVWQGDIYLLVWRNQFAPEKVLKREVAFRMLTPQDKDYLPMPYLEQHELTPLEQLNPIGRVDDTTYGLQLRRSQRYNEYWPRHDVEQMTIQGNFYKEFKDKKKPFFRSQAEMESSRARTMVASREYFHETIGILSGVLDNILYPEFRAITKKIIKATFDEQNSLMANQETSTFMKLNNDLE